MAEAKAPWAKEPDADPDSSDTDWTGVGQDLLDALRNELAEERSRKSSLEQRSLAASSAAAAAVALLLGLGSQYEGRWQDVFFSLLFIGGVLFLISAYAGWQTAKITGYQEIDLKEYDGILDDGWPDTLGAFRRFLADGVIAVLKDARKQNDKKVTWNTRALRFLFFGAGVVAIEIGIVLLDRVWPLVK